MEWKNLSITARNIVERCWGFDDQPQSFTIKHGDDLYGIYVAEAHIEEVRAYQKERQTFDFSREGDTITVTGNCVFGSWAQNDSGDSNKETPPIFTVHASNPTAVGERVSRLLTKE